MEHRSQDCPTYVTSHDALRNLNNCTSVGLTLSSRSPALKLRRRLVDGDWFTDTLYSKVTSIQGITCAQVFTNGSFTTAPHPLDSKAKVAQSLTEFADDVGIPDTLLSDGAPEVIGPKTNFMKEVNRLKMRLSETFRSRTLEPELHHRTQNR